MFAELQSIKSLDDIRLLYFKYKDSVGFTIGLALLLIGVTVLIFIQIALPQANNWFSIQKEVADTTSRITLLKANSAMLAAMDPAIVDRQFDLVSTALPFEKDYTGFITAIDTATLISGMRRDDYSFAVGNLSTKSAELSPNTVISVKIKITGDADKLLVFLQTMQKQLPLSEIVAVSLNSGGSNVEINFFFKYKPDNLQIPFTDPLRALTENHKRLLKTLEDNAGAAQAAESIAPSLIEDEDSSGSAL